MSVKDHSPIRPVHKEPSIRNVDKEPASRPVHIEATNKESTENHINKTSDKVKSRTGAISPVTVTGSAQKDRATELRQPEGPNTSGK